MSIIFYSLGGGSSSGGGSTSAATESAQGVAQIATETQVTQGTETGPFFVTPARLQSKINTALVGALEYKGSYNNVATPNHDLTTAKKGDFYIIGNAGGGTLAGVAISQGDHIVFNQDSASPLAAAYFDVIVSSDAVQSVNGATGVVSLASTDLTDTGSLVRNNANSTYSAVTIDMTAATVTAATQSDNDNSPKVATTAYVDSMSASAGKTIEEIQDIVGAMVSGNTETDITVTYQDGDGTLDFTVDATVARLSGPTFTGVPSAPTATQGTNTTQIATTAFVTAAVPSNSDDVSEGSTNLYYTDARVDTRIAAADSDDVGEGSTNLYYTDARADARIAVASINDLSDVNTTVVSSDDFLRYNSSTSKFEPVSLDSDVVSEGSTNLYYTDARADARITAASINDLSDVDTTGVTGNSILVYDSIASDFVAMTGATALTAIGALGTSATTSNLNEGTNLYYTNARVDTRINNTSIGALSDVTINSVQTNEILKWDGSAWVNGTASGGGSRPTVTEYTGAIVDLTSAPASTVLEVIAVCNASSGTQTVNLHTAVGHEGLKYQIKRTGTVNVTVTPSTSPNQEYIDHSGQTSFVLSTQYSNLTLVSDGTNWLII